MKALVTALMITATLAGISAAHADGKTREQVKQELQSANAAHQISRGELDYPPHSAEAQTAGKTRAQVREELIQAKAHGEYSRGELDYPPPIH